MVEVRDDLLGVVVGVLQDGSGHADLGVGEEGGEPLAVDVDAVSDDHVVLQREAEAVADDLHAPVDLLLGLQRARLGLGRHRDAEVLSHRVHHRGHNLIVSQYLFLKLHQIFFTINSNIFFTFTTFSTPTCLPSSGGSLARTDCVAVPRVWSCTVREDQSAYIVALGGGRPAA